MSLRGIWFPADSSNNHEAKLTLGASDHFHLAHSDQSITGFANDLSFSDRVGNIPRKVIFSDGSIFQTDDNDAIDEWIKSSKHEGANAGWIHSLENSWSWIGTALVVTVLFGFIGIKYGLPWASHKIAYQLPVSANTLISEGALKTMDELILEPSELSESTKTALQARFKTLVGSIDKEGFKYKLHFRKMQNTPNAFALPSGTVVVTDRLVEIIKEPKELDAILLHEIGHITNRHGMRQAIQASALTIAIVMWTGDTSAIDEWVTALPVFLLQSNYSRGFETESDIFAFENMIKLGIDPIHFGNGLERITVSFKSGSESALNDRVEKIEETLEYFSSHPPTEDRAKLSKEYSEKFHRK